MLDTTQGVVGSIFSRTRVSNEKFLTGMMKSPFSRHSFLVMVAHAVSDWQLEGSQVELIFSYKRRALRTLN